MKIFPKNILDLFLPRTAVPGHFGKAAGLFLFFFAFSGLSAQSIANIDGWNDGEIAQKYLLWAQQEINEGRYREALAGLERAADFANASSDISFLLAAMRDFTGQSRHSVIEALDEAIQRNHWVFYNEAAAHRLKAHQLIAMRRFHSALDYLDRSSNLPPPDFSFTKTSIFPDSVFGLTDARLRLMVFRGMALRDEAPAALAHFRSFMLTAMDRNPTDTFLYRIFFEYARNRSPQPSELPSGDLNLLALVLRRLPFVLEDDPALAWMVVPFMYNVGDARRLLASYRSGGLISVHEGAFFPAPDSIPPALNLGLIDDAQATDELFSGNHGNSIPLRIINETFDLLRSEEGRSYFTQRLLTFSGIITSDSDNDGHIDGYTFYEDGVITEFRFDRDQSRDADLRILFSTDGIPVSADAPVAGQGVLAAVQWQRYPSVQRVTLGQETFTFRPADFNFAPVRLISLGGSMTHAGLPFPVPSFQFLNLTRRALVASALTISRPSAEFDGGTEQIFLERGIPLRAIETVNGMQVSVTEFENGLPVVQFLDLILDGRMETIRRFRRPGLDFPWPDLEGIFDHRSLIASSESDWTGEGRFITRELYLEDGTVVYQWDMDGSGTIDFFETRSNQEP